MLDEFSDPLSGVEEVHKAPRAGRTGSPEAAGLSWFVGDRIAPDRLGS
jgi:hypothetical protein